MCPILWLALSPVYISDSFGTVCFLYDELNKIGWANNPLVKKSHHENQVFYAEI